MPRPRSGWRCSRGRGHEENRIARLACGLPRSEPAGRGLLPAGVLALHLSPDSRGTLVSVAGLLRPVARGSESGDPAAGASAGGRAVAYRRDGSLAGGRVRRRATGIRRRADDASGADRPRQRFQQPVVQRRGAGIGGVGTGLGRRLLWTADPVGGTAGRLWRQPVRHDLGRYFRFGGVFAGLPASPPGGSQPPRGGDGPRLELAGAPGVLPRRISAAGMYGLIGGDVRPAGAHGILVRAPAFSGGVGRAAARRGVAVDRLHGLAGGTVLDRARDYTGGGQRWHRPVADSRPGGF